MKTTDIQAVKYMNDEVSALYQGSTLIYKKTDPKTYILAGSFSEPGEYTFRYNGTDTPILLNDDNTFNMVVDGLKSCNSMFRDNTKLLTITDFPYVNAHDMSNASYMFYGCSNLNSVNLSNLDTEKFTSLSYMFYGCSSLKKIDLSHFNTDNCNSFAAMFYDCNALNVLNLTSFNTVSSPEKS